MSETLKSTIAGTIIIGIFMLISMKMVTGTMWDMARKAKAYVEVQKTELKQIVKAEKHKATDVAIDVASIIGQE
jgi:Na+/H+-translocating membrane pyrophosphatase